MGTAIVTGCYPGGPTDLSQLDVQVTTFDPDYDFSKPKTYAMPDSVEHLGDPSDNSYVMLSRAYDSTILQQVASEMAAYGWTREMNPDVNGADVYVLVSAAGVSNWSMSGRSPPIST